VLLEHQHGIAIDWLWAVANAELMGDVMGSTGAFD